MEDVEASIDREESPSRSTALLLGTAVALYVADQVTKALVVANMIGVKLFSVDVAGLDVEHTAGMVPFPITFLLTDLINEFYGRRAARMVAWIAFGMALFAFVLVSLARLLPILEGIPGTADERSFEVVFGGSTLKPRFRLWLFSGSRSRFATTKLLSPNTSSGRGSRVAHSYEAFAESQSNTR